MLEKVLVIGASGYLGGRFKEYLERKQHEVVGTYNSSANEGLQKLEAEDYDQVEEMIRQGRFSHIINFAGIVNHSSDPGDFLRIYNNHFGITCNILRASMACSHRPKIIGIGSADEYGMTNGECRETDRCVPVSHYSFAKLAQYEFGSYMRRCYGVDYTHVRPFLVYGPGQKCNRLVPYILSRCMLGESINLKSPFAVRDFLYIEDFCNVLERIMSREREVPSLINVGSGVGNSVIDVAKSVIEIVGSGKIGNLSSEGERRQADTCYANIELLRSHVGWSSKIDLKEGLKIMIENMESKG